MIRVLIVDDHHLVREGLRNLLEKEHDFNVVGEASNGQEAIATVESVRPDVVVMDVEMPVINGIEATSRIRDTFSRTKVLMLSMHSDPALIRRAIRSGARGYVLKHTVSGELVSAIRTVCRGVVHRSRALQEAESVYGQFVHDTKPCLTPREREILQLITAGHSNRQIASSLSISIKTVAAHRTNLMAKLNTHSLPDLVHTSLKLGLIELKS